MHRFTCIAIHCQDGREVVTNTCTCVMYRVAPSFDSCVCVTSIQRAYAEIHVLTYTFTCTCIRKGICRCICMCMCVYAYMYMCTNTYTCICICTCFCTCLCMCKSRKLATALLEFLLP